MISHCTSLSLTPPIDRKTMIKRQKFYLSKDQLPQIFHWSRSRLHTIFFSQQCYREIILLQINPRNHAVTIIVQWFNVFCSNILCWKILKGNPSQKKQRLTRIVCNCSKNAILLVLHSFSTNADIDMVLLRKFVRKANQVQILSTLLNTIQFNPSQRLEVMNWQANFVSQVHSCNKTANDL